MSKEQQTRNQLEILVDLATKQSNIDKEQIAALTDSLFVWKAMAEDLYVYKGHRYRCNVGRPHGKCNCGLDELESCYAKLEKTIGKE